MKRRGFVQALTVGAVGVIVGPRRLPAAPVVIGVDPGDIRGTITVAYLGQDDGWQRELVLHLPLRLERAGEQVRVVTDVGPLPIPLPRDQTYMVTIPGGEIRGLFGVPSSVVPLRFGTPSYMTRPHMGDELSVTWPEVTLTW